MSLKPVDVKTVEKWLASGDCVLVDIREPNETAAERIRTQQNADKLSSCAGGCEGFYLEGGIEAWKKAGHKVEH